MQFKSKAAWAASFLVAELLAATAGADTTINPSTEYLNRIKVAQTVQPSGETPFGESINLYKGGVGFRQTDLSFPGNGPVITFARGYEIGGGKNTLGNEEAMGDWSLSIPRISTIVTGDRLGNHGAWQVNGLQPDARCSQFGEITSSPFIELSSPWWSGYQLITADGGSQPLLRRTAENTLKPTSPGVYDIVTPGHWMISCLASTGNGMPGEAFLATAPDGTRYWFDQLVYGPVVDTLVEDLTISATTGEPPTTAPGAATDPVPAVFAGTGRIILPRKMASMYVSRIEDRFGNSITYSYSNGRAVSVDASDGRQVRINWRSDAPVVASIVLQPGTPEAQTWSYDYTDPVATTRSLSRVVLPDQSAWSFSLSNAAASGTGPIYSATDPIQCGKRTWPAAGSVFSVGSITHPSGLVGNFEFKVVGLARSYVPTGCGSPGGTVPAYEDIPPVYLAVSLTKKTFSGAGMANQVWLYSYSPASGSTANECAASGCQNSSWVEVTDPVGRISRFTHSTRWGATEGKLLSVISGVSSPGQANPVGLDKQTHAYASFATGPYPARLGDALDTSFGRTNNDTVERLTPEQLTVTERQGVSFSRTVDSYDSYGTPLVSTLGSTGNAGGNTSRVESSTFHHDTAKWVIGQAESVTAAGKTVSRTDYDPTLSLPIRYTSFGIVQQTLSYNADGSVATVRDGGNNLTSLSNWYRGVPRLVTFANSQVQSAAVDGIGRLLSATDELGSATNYAYDAMGRLTGITYPAGDSTVWNANTRSFLPVAAAEYGIAAGHWKQMVQTGNGRSTTFYDAQWRPLLTLGEDLGNPGSQSFVVSRYDAAGRMVFSSYPVSTLASVDELLPGVSTVYDSLGRVIQVKQDSELGVLTSTTEYLPGFQTRVTNPRGFQTVTGYQVFDTPDSSRPVLIQAPEGVTTTITRDAFGKPLQITRSGN